MAEGGFDYAEYRRKRRAAGKDRSVRVGEKVTTERAAKRRLSRKDGSEPKKGKKNGE